MNEQEEPSCAQQDHQAAAHRGAQRTRVGEKLYIRKRGKRGTYVAEFWHEGKNCKRSLKTPNREIAIRRALKLDSDLTAGSYAAPRAPIALRSTIAEFLEVKRGEDRAAKTITKYREWLESFATFADANSVTSLQQITSSLFERYRAVRKQGQSPKSMYTGLTIVKSFIKWCTSPGREYLERNPVAGCKVPEPYTTPKFTPARKQVKALIDGASDDVRARYAVLAYTGLRAGEMRMLRPQDVDLAGGWIHVVARPGWMPKTRRARKVPIHPLLREHLQCYLSALPTSAASRPYFFCAPASHAYPKADRPIDLRDLNEGFQKLGKSLRIPVGRKNDGLVIHSLRHFFETWAINSGVPQVVVDAWMGHAGDGSMARIYYGKSNRTSRRFMKGVRFVKRIKQLPATNVNSSTTLQGADHVQ
ncbi:MAG: site-specific integrase [Phycisphaerales bacterium]|nr:site-specific integrase [Phycisphaerales bacterium]